MAVYPDLAPVAALIGEPARAAMLSELVGGWPLTATELAARAGVAPSTASGHLAKLVAGGLIRVDAQGSYRHYRLAGPEVADILEALAVHAQPTTNGHRRTIPHELGFARSCYDHLAGQLGVAVRDGLVEHGVLLDDGAEHRVTRSGEAWFAGFGVDLAAARRAKRSFARSCLDWSERRPHLAGALGSALLGRLVDLGWILRRPGERTVELTDAGRLGLAGELGVQLEAPSHI